METKTILFLGIIGLLILLTVNTGKPQMPAANTATQQNNIDICNEIINPSASVDCQYGQWCDITVTGDSRVEYSITQYAKDYSKLSISGPATILSAGRPAGLYELLVNRSNNNRVYSVEVVPVHDGRECTNRKIIIYKSQFTGEVP